MSVKASEIAEFLRAKLYGDDLVVEGVSASHNPQPGTLTFIKRGTRLPAQDRFLGCLVIADVMPWMRRIATTIPASNPRHAWARVVNQFFPPKDLNAGQKLPAPWPENSFGRLLSAITADTQIGEHCTIKSGAVIGQEGFGFEIDEDGHPYRIPHLGRVVIGNHVEIGCNTVIARGTIGDTVIHDHVKIDDAVFIAHNVEIGENTLVIAKAEISGSVKVGRNCWIGASACIREHVTVGDGALVGMGAVVVKDVEPGAVVAGNPARKIRMRRAGE